MVKNNFHPTLQSLYRKGKKLVKTVHTLSFNNLEIAMLISLVLDMMVQAPKPSKMDKDDVAMFMTLISISDKLSEHMDPSQSALLVTLLTRDW